MRADRCDHPVFVKVGNEDGIVPSPFFLGGIRAPLGESFAVELGAEFDFSGLVVLVGDTFREEEFGGVGG